MEHTYTIEGMHCESCVSKLTQALQSVPEIISARVSLQPPQATVTMQNHIPLSDLQQAARLAGNYSLREAQPSTTDLIADSSEINKKQESLYPLILIIVYLFGTVLLVGWISGQFSLRSFMTWFMGGFFLVFSFFKMLDLRGFADAYRSYDVIARSVPIWGFVYPFAELVLGIAYLAGWIPVVTNLTTLVLMLVGSVGVLQSLLRGNVIRCACLGTVLNLPMTKVTLVEDLSMAAMAVVTLILPH